ncbi:DUF6777 domain-containing protein [Geodermatophilus maliterrae]|uniref:DUF6777 domain-containing protein n=1 Tax=Geodermatophilus maliterrae TaxID=3162531 RepID=A0ABV3XM82_9ACTN
MIRLFVSYSRKDEAAVEGMITDLGRAHLSVWHDQALHGGDPWWQDILRRIRECDVFLFALSENSLASKPCLAELSYARALGLPLLPVQVGPVGNLRLTPVADIQVVDYRERTLAHGMALIEAIQDVAAGRRPLPDPLPEPPPVPFEYLLRLGTAIGAAQLTPDQQGDFIRQLRECLETEEDEGVKDDARELLRALRRRPDITYRNAGAVDHLLADLAATDTREIHFADAGGRHPPPAGTTVPATGADAEDTERGQPPGPQTSPADSDADRRRPRHRAAGSTAAAPGGGTRSRLVPRVLISGVLLLVLAALATSVLLFRSANTTMVHAEAADDPGDYPAFVTLPADTEPGQRPTPPPGETVSGNTPGLYGGTGANTCDVEAMARHLEAHPDMATAWAGVREIRRDQIRPFLALLTPVTLRTDTAVTNHGYDDGRVIPFQSVLQAGTAVLVDQWGVPRVRCACGNPLKPPDPPPRARYEESAWPEFSTRTVAVITRAPEIVTTFVIVQPDTREVVARPQGTRGDQDQAPDPADAAAARDFGERDSGPSSRGPTDESPTEPDDPAGNGDSSPGDESPSSGPQSSSEPEPTVEETPGEEVPTEEVPTEETPTEIPEEETPTEEVPAEETPTEEVPAEETPTEIPEEETPTEEVPAEETPTEEVPEEETPTEEVPAEETPTEEVPAEETPTEIPEEETPTEIPEEETPTEIPEEEAPEEEPVEEEPPADGS